MPSDFDSAFDVVGEFGNSWLVDDGDQIQQITRTLENEIAYEHGEHGFIYDEDDLSPLEFVVNGDTIRVFPTNNKRIYTIEVNDGQLVQNYPDDKNRVLSGVIEAMTTGESNTLLYLYGELESESASPDTVNELQRQLGVVPPAIVRETETGWVLMDLFLLTWHGNWYLLSRDRDQGSYQLGHWHGNNMQRTPTTMDFIGLTPSETTIDAHVTLLTQLLEQHDIDLGVARADIAFLSRAKWISEYRDRHDDDVFWEQVESHVYEARGIKYQPDDT